MAKQNDEIKARKRFIDQKGQWHNTTPKDVKKKNAAAWKKLEESLTPEQRKKFGLKPTAAKKKTK